LNILNRKKEQSLIAYFRDNFSFLFT